MKQALFATLFLVFVFGCEKKEIPLASHPGAQLYHGLVRADVRCYRCHGPIGEGSSRAPALVTEGKTLPRPLFIKTVLNGRNRMPPFASVLSENDILSMIAWLEAVNHPQQPHGGG